MMSVPEGEKVPDKKRVEAVVYPSFQRPKTADMTTTAFTESLVKIQKHGQSVVAIGPTVIHLDDRLKAVTWTQPDVQHPPDREMFARMGAFKDPLALAGKMKYASSVVRSNGTKKGLCSRMVEKLTGKRVMSIGEFGLPRILAMVDRLPLRDMTSYKYLTWTKYERENFKSFPRYAQLNETQKTNAGDDWRQADPILRALNRKASLGFPYQGECTAQEVAKINFRTRLPALCFSATKNLTLVEPQMAVYHAVSEACAMIDELNGCSGTAERRAKWNSWVLTNPWIVTFLLKRKDQIADREEFFTKARPYGTTPQATKHLFQLATLPIEDNLLGFWEEPRSISAYRFSPYYGGAGVLVEHFSQAFEQGKGPMFKQVSYGDDQLWLFRFDDGTGLLIGPDVAAMDMATQSWTAERLAAWFEVATKRGAPLLVSFLVRIWLETAFHHYIHVGGSNVLEKFNSLISGIPGTTLINLGSSATMGCEVETKLQAWKAASKPFLRSTFGVFLQEVMVDVHRLTNFELKGMTGEDWSGIPSQEILSSSTLREQGILVPFLQTTFPKTPYGFIGLPANTDKFGGTLVCPMTPGDEAKKIADRLARIMGIYFVGGWYDESFAKFLNDTYRDYARLAPDVPIEATTMDGFDFESVVELTTALQTTLVKASDGLPSREFMADFNVLPRAAFTEKWVRGGALRKAFAVPVVSVTQRVQSADQDSDLEALLAQFNPGGAPAGLGATVLSSTPSTRASMPLSKMDRDEVAELLNAGAAAAKDVKQQMKPVQTFKQSALGQAAAKSDLGFKAKLARAKERWAIRDAKMRVAAVMASESLSGSYLLALKAKRRKAGKAIGVVAAGELAYTTYRNNRDDLSEDDLGELATMEQREAAVEAERSLKKYNEEESYFRALEKKSELAYRVIGLNWADETEREEEENQVAFEKARHIYDN